jgi:REP element-mobilizing transposase RayT
MARRPRIEIDGGLYHIIARGNNRQLIFGDAEDCRKLLSQLEAQKLKLPFYLYAYCLMPNHIHLLVERRDDQIGRLMHRVLTGYSQYHNRRYQRTGHLFQGRYKSILCQTDQYLTELVRYIHLNPVRAKIVARPHEYDYSSHRAYLGLEDPPKLVDVDPVLRRFGAKKRVAREMYQKFILAGMKLGHQDELYRAAAGGVLGADEFIDSVIHRIGDAGGRTPTGAARKSPDMNLNKLVRAVEIATGIGKAELCGPGKAPEMVMARETLVFIGHEAGATCAALARHTGLDISVVSRRLESARMRIAESNQLKALVRSIKKQLP